MSVRSIQAQFQKFVQSSTPNSFGTLSGVEAAALWREAEKGGVRTSEINAIRDIYNDAAYSDHRPNRSTVPAESFWMTPAADRAIVKGFEKNDALAAIYPFW